VVDLADELRVWVRASKDFLDVRGINRHLAKGGVWEFDFRYRGHTAPWFSGWAGQLSRVRLLPEPNGFVVLPWVIASNIAVWDEKHENRERPELPTGTYRGWRYDLPFLGRLLEQLKLSGHAGYGEAGLPVPEGGVEYPVSYIGDLWRVTGPLSMTVDRPSLASWHELRP
jgi:hypothetical protein